MFEVRIPQIEVVRSLDEGLTSKVVQAKTESGAHFAFKVLRDIEYYPCLQDEAKVLIRLCHPNII